MNNLTNSNLVKMKLNNLLDDKMYRIICFGDSITNGYHSRFKKMVREIITTIFKRWEISGDSQD